MKNEKYTVIDLFSGAGGLSQGFCQAGFKLLAGIDNYAPALKTYQHNIKGAQALNENLYDAEASILDVKKHLHGKKPDVIIGGPPCQGFSLTGSRDINDSRNTLYVAVVKFVRYFKPKAFLIENVPGMATLYGGRVKKQIVNTFEDMGYLVSVTPRPLLAADYGVPQMRKRMFFVGFKRSLHYDYFNFPKPYLDKRHYVTTSDAISDLPSLRKNLGSNVSHYIMPPRTKYQKKMRGHCKYLYNHVGTNHTEHVKKVISMVPDGGNYKDLPKGVGDSRKFHVAWTRYNSHKPSNTIDTGHRNHFHYKWNRVPTVRENARLQSFPDSFRFYGTKTQQGIQVGNAVPPLLAQAIASKIRIHLNNGFITNPHKKPGRYAEQLSLNLSKNNKD